MFSQAQIRAIKSKQRDPARPFQDWIYDQTRKSGPRSLAEVAEGLTKAGVPVSVERAKSWVKRTEFGARRIPLDIAMKIEKLWGFKASEENWPNGFVTTSRKRSD